MAILKIILIFVIFLFWTNADAAWKINQGTKAFSKFPPVQAIIATVPAKSRPGGISARLQIECFTHPQLQGLNFGVVLSKQPANGFIAWRYQYDDRPIISRGPYSRAAPNPNSISLGDSKSDELKGLPDAHRLRLTLLPADGSTLSFEFDVTGAREAIAAIPCVERRSM